MVANRFDYVPYDETAQAQQNDFKKAYSEIADKLEALPSGRAVSLALTKLEEAYMWIGKAIRDDQISRNGSAPLQEERTDD
jgi:hypothetical protein